MDEKSKKEQRIRSITLIYYSRPEIQRAIADFSVNREVVPRYYEGFGKRPDTIQFARDVLELAKKGATSFHCSEELWRDPLELSSEMSEGDYNTLRIGWDFLIDIDSKYIDYSRIMAIEIIKFLEYHGVKNIGIKFSGSKGFHLIIPWKSFPKELNGMDTSDMFPEWPRILLNYIREKTKNKVIEKITLLSTKSKYVKDYDAFKEVVPDLVLVSPRHLFRMPYSLHEKTSLSSIVLTKEELENFDLKDADPFKIKKENIRDFIPDSQEGEASTLLIQALDWNNEENREEPKREISHQEIKIENLSDSLFPPCIKNILKGMEDGKKRGLFVLLNFFRSIGLDKAEIEKRVWEWNDRNKSKLKEGYIKSQLNWFFRKKPFPPPNCREFYQNIGVCSPDNLCEKIKNPLSYAIKKNFLSNSRQKRNTPKKPSK